MDALALLCTLHADGPATLQRLRGVGLGSLEALQGVGAERLGETLGMPAAAARRLLREARHLAQRLEADLLDRDEGVPALAGLAGRRPVQALDPGRLRGEPGTPGGEVGPRAGGERAMLARVLETWRELEESSGDAPAVGTGCGAAHSKEPGAPHAESIAATRCEGVALTELDAGIARELANQGLVDSGAFLRRDLLELSRTSGIAYTRLARVAFLARRAGAGESPPEPASGPRFSPAEVPRPVVEPRPHTPGAREGVGGPFA